MRAVDFVRDQEFADHKLSFLNHWTIGEGIVLDDLRRVTDFARMKERQFATHINRKNTLEIRWEMNTLQRALDTMRRRNDEISALFKRLYEDNVLGRITNEQFRMLSADYNAEQKALQETIPEKRCGWSG